MQGSAAFAFAFPRGWRGPFLGGSGTPPLFCSPTSRGLRVLVEGGRVGRVVPPFPPKGQGDVWPRWGLKTWWGEVPGITEQPWGCRGGGRTSGPSSTGPCSSRSAASGSSAEGALGGDPHWGLNSRRDEGLPVPTSPPSSPQSWGNAESALPRGQVPLLWSRAESAPSAPYNLPESD